MLELDVGVAPEPCDGEQLIEVERLAMVDDIEDRVGLPLAHPILDRRQVGRRIKERSILLLHDHRRGLAFDEHTDRAFALAGKALVDEAFHDAAEPVLVKAFAQRVIKGHTEPRVDDFDLGHAKGQNFTPELEVGGVAAVEGRGFEEHIAGDVGVGFEQRSEQRIGFGRFLLRFEGGVLRLEFGELLLGTAELLGGLLELLGIGRGRLGVELGDSLLGFFDLERDGGIFSCCVSRYSTSELTRR